MKNVEMAELLKKYKPMIENGLVSVDDLLNCTDEEMKVYQSIDTESIMNLCKSLLSGKYALFDNRLRSFLLTFLSLDEIRKNKDNIDVYLFISNIISNFGVFNKLMWFYFDKYPDKSIFSDEAIRIFTKISEHRAEYLNSIMRIIGSTDDCKLQEDKLEMFIEYLKFKFSCEEKDCYICDLDYAEALIEAQNMLNIKAFNNFLYSFNPENYDDETFEFIKDTILTSNPNASKGLAEIALDLDLIAQKDYFIPMFFYNLYPYSEIYDLLQNKNLLSSSFSNYISTIFFLGKSLDKYAGKKCGFLFDLAVDKDSILSPSRCSDMKLISECNNLDLVSHLCNVARSKKSLNSSYHDKDMQLIKSLDGEFSECVQWKTKTLSRIACDSNSLNSSHHDDDMKLIGSLDIDSSTYIRSKIEPLATVACNRDSLNSPHHSEDMKLISSLVEKSDDVVDCKIGCLARIACDKESLNSPHHSEDMNFIYSLPDDVAPSKLNLLSTIATNHDSLSSPYHRYNMEFLIQNEEHEFSELYTSPSSLNSKYHQFNLETLKKFSSSNVEDREEFIKILTNDESLQSDSHIANVLDFIEKIESRGTTVDLLIDELSIEPDRELSEPGRVLQKVRIPDKKVES